MTDEPEISGDIPAEIIERLHQGIDRKTWMRIREVLERWPEPKDVEKFYERLLKAWAHSAFPCLYCGLPKSEWNNCKRGFPGCARADDAMI